MLARSHTLREQLYNHLGLRSDWRTIPSIGHPCSRFSSRILGQLATNLSIDLSIDRNFSSMIKKYDIHQKLFCCYDENWRPVGSQEVMIKDYQNFLTLLTARIFLTLEKGDYNHSLIKDINVFFKAHERVNLPKFMDGAYECVLRIKDKKIERMRKSFKSKKVLCFDNLNKDCNGRPKITLPLDVLFYEGTIARSYLECLHFLGYEPRQIIHLIPENDLVTNKPLARFLPGLLRREYISTIQKKKIHYWPQHLFRNQRELCNAVFWNLQRDFKINHESLMSLVNLKPLSYYSNNIVELYFKTLGDENIFNFLKQQDPTSYLFTGGGIIPKRTLKIKDKKFIHIHPGYLPKIRGADCLLWSNLIMGQPSASCFYMNAEIDMGNILNSVFLPKFVLPEAIYRMDDLSIYRLIYSFVDPWARALILGDTIVRTNNLEKIKQKKQKANDGTTFYFMHPEIRKNAFEAML
ncbi:hypothetical protein N9M31_06935 [Alphaproteobacteria bacterium]|nr:hypothetical protein [Alphaproteobacteria bacterium]